MKAILVIDVEENMIGEVDYTILTKGDMCNGRAELKPMQKGEWIRDFDGNEFYWYCTHCKENYYEEDLYIGGNEFPNFCPNCGADMRR